MIFLSVLSILFAWANPAEIVTASISTTDDLRVVSNEFLLDLANQSSISEKITAPDGREFCFHGFNSYALPRGVLGILWLSDRDLRLGVRDAAVEVAARKNWHSGPISTPTGGGLLATFKHRGQVMAWIHLQPRSTRVLMMGKRNENCFIIARSFTANFPKPSGMRFATVRVNYTELARVRRVGSESDRGTVNALYARLTDARKAKIEEELAKV